MLYNDKSPLENHHTAAALSLLKQHGLLSRLSKVRARLASGLFVWVGVEVMAWGPPCADTSHASV